MELEGIAHFVSPPQVPINHRVAGYGGDVRKLRCLPLLHLSVPPLHIQGVGKQNLRQFVKQLLDGGLCNHAAAAISVLVPELHASS